MNLERRNSWFLIFVLPVDGKQRVVSHYEIEATSKSTYYNTNTVQPYVLTVISYDRPFLTKGVKVYPNM